MAKATMVDLLRMCQDARPDEIEQYKAFVGPEWNVEDVVNDLFNRAVVIMTNYGAPPPSGA